MVYDLFLFLPALILHFVIAYIYTFIANIILIYRFLLALSLHISFNLVSAFLPQNFVVFFAFALVVLWRVGILSGGVGPLRRD